jgi:peptidoglycan/xylan/chitin deacetylase (PgdA/CDA1 family)
MITISKFKPANIFMNIIRTKILLSDVGSIATSILPIAYIIFRQKCLICVSESDVFYGRVRCPAKATEDILKIFTAKRPRRRLALASFAFIIGIQCLHSLFAYADAANLIPNPSVETTDATGTGPLNWQTGKSGTNTTTFTYNTNGGYTGSKSLNVNMTSRTSGTAHWNYTPPVSVKPNTKYTYSENYKSNVSTRIDIEYTRTNNSTSTVTAANPGASATNWASVTISFTTPANAKQVTIRHILNKKGNLQTDNFSLEEVAPLNTPTVSITAPASGSIVSGIQTINAAASDAVGIAGVQFKIDGANLGSEDTTTPYSTNWTTTGLQNCSSHSISATARNTGNITATAIETVTVQNGATVSITAPAAGASVAGTVPFNASATGACAQLGVQFKVDGVNIGAADISAPFSVNLDTTTLTNGPHTLTAIGSYSGGTATATQIIQVNNPSSSACPGNLIQNPSVETASGGLPTNWNNSSWGTNTSTFSYLNTGHSGDHSLRTQITAFTNGAATWYSSQPQPVNPAGGQYLYSDWYQSDVDSELSAEIKMNDGTKQFYYFDNVWASTGWRQFRTVLDVPQGAVSITFYHVIFSLGTLTTDDFCFAPYTPVPLNRGLVSVTYDDGETNQYTNAYPLHIKYGIPGTFYIISSKLTDQPTYMTAEQIGVLHANGMEIGSHSVTHPSLTELSQANLVNEMSQSQSTLQQLPIGAVTDFAYPYGHYNQNTITVGQQYYQSQRNSDTGFNTKDLLDLTSLKVQGVYYGIPPAQIKTLINRAINEKSWLILMYHRIDIPNSNDLYTIPPGELDEVLKYIDNNKSNIGAVTVDQAIKEISPQL